MPKFRFDNYHSYRLIPSLRGRHQFGGPPMHEGTIPQGTNVPLQLVLSIDLTDPNCPIQDKTGITSLPLYFPFKYGMGGPQIQYAVRSNSEIKILHLSKAEPDAADVQYLQVTELPRLSLELVPLTYEQARILAFLSCDGFFPALLSIQGHFEPNQEDRQIISQLELKNLIRIGNQCAPIPNVGDIFCRNPKCEFYDRRVHWRPIATVPPIPVDGSDDFWCEFRGYVLFCFGLCYYCGTIVAFNVAG